MRLSTPPPRLLTLIAVLSEEAERQGTPSMVTAKRARLIELTGYSEHTVRLALHEAITGGAIRLCHYTWADGTTYELHHTHVAFALVELLSVGGAA